MPLSQLLQRSTGELQAELQLILNAVVEGLCGLDARGHVTFCNDALLKMTGYRTEELVGNNLHAMVHHSRADGTKYPEEECGLRKALDASQEIHVVGEFLWRKEGSCFPVEYWAHPLRHPSSPTESVVTIQDITERERATEALRTSEEELRRILASMPDVAWTSDRERRTTYMSPKVEAVLGYTKQEFCVGTSLRSGLIHPEDFSRVNRSHRALFEKQTAFDEEYRIRRKDGTWIWIHDRATGTHEENGILYADGVFSDITRRKQAEAELQWKTVFLEAQANSTIDGILVVAGNGQILLHNQRFMELFQIPPELRATKEDLGLLRYVVSLIKDPDSFLAKVNYLYGHPTETSRDEIELKDGRVLDRYSAPVLDKEGKCYGRIWTFRDMTEAKRNEETLRQLSMAVEQSPAAVVITDPRGNITYVNRKFTEGTGYRLDEAIGKNPRILKSDLTPPEVYRNLWSTITQGLEWHGEFCNRKKNGELYWEAATIRAIRNAKGAITHYLAVKQDITERRRAEEALKASEKRYRLLFERNMAGVCRTTPEGRVLECNQAAAHIFGYDSAEEVIGLPIANLYHEPAEREVFIRKLRSEKILTNCELRLRRKNGDPFWVLANFSFGEDDSAGGEIIEGTLIDITERKQAEEELKASEKRYRLLFERNLAGVFRTTVEGRVLECNPAAAHLFGCDSPEELLTLPISKFYPTVADREVLLNKLKVEKSVTNHEMRFQRKDGEAAWAMLNLSLLEDDSDAGRIIEGTFIDITERKQAEEGLYESRQMLQAILDAIPQRVFWKDRNSIYLGCNRAFAIDAGLDAPAAISGKSDFDLAWTGSAERYLADDRLVMEGGAAKLNFEERQSRPDGSALWLQSNKLPLRDREGNVTGIIGTYEDITERKRAEKELRLTQFSLERASDAVEWIDPQSRIVYVNQAECLALGRKREEFLSLSIPDIDPLFPREVWGTFWEQLKARGSMTFETQHQTKEGRRFPVEVTANFLEFDGQEYCFAFARDITERRELESQLRQAHKLEGIGQLAAGIAHEINTPTQFVTDNLTFVRDSWKSTYELLEQYRGVIRNAAGTLPEGVAAGLADAERNCDLDFIAAEVPRAIEQGLDGAHRVAKIVRAMKEFSHPDSADKIAADLNKTIESTITVAHSEWKYVAEVVTEFDETLPAVVCYPGDINQVILNLVVNAAHAIKEKVKEGEKGRITVATRTRAEFAEISITDTGTGIPEKIRTRIFDPFFTTKEVGKGTGQGLSLAHGVVVKKHGGKIWFETEMGVGTTFFIQLPIKAAAAVKEN